MAFVHGAKSNPNKSEWIKKIGQYKYYSLILGGFNPVEADKIFDTTAEAIAEAYVSKLAHEYIEPNKK